MYVLTIDNDVEKLRHVMAKVEWPMLTVGDRGDPAPSLFLDYFRFASPLWLQVPTRSASLRIDIVPGRRPVTWHGLTTAGDSALGRQAIAALMRLDGVEGASVTSPASLDDFNNSYIAGSDGLCCPDSEPSAAINGLEVFDAGRIVDRLSDLAAGAVAMGYPLSYQALFKPGRPDRMLMARARKAAAALKRHPYVPRGVADAHDAIAARVEWAGHKVEEAVSTSEDGSAWLRHWLASNSTLDGAAPPGTPPRPPVAPGDLERDAFAYHIHPEVLSGDVPVADDASLIPRVWSDAEAAALFRCDSLWRPNSRLREPPPVSPLPLFFQGGSRRPSPSGPAGASAAADPFYFVSYAHRDIAAVRQILNTLIAGGNRIWIDEQIPVSEEWDERLETMITTSAGLLVFLSPSYIASKHCRRELKFADALDKKIYAGALTELSLERGLSYMFASLQYAKGSLEQIAASLHESIRRPQ